VFQLSTNASFVAEKNECTHNIMAVCDFDMLFSYVYVAWEGTTNDGRIFRDAVRVDQGFEWPTNGRCVTYKSIISCQIVFHVHTLILGILFMDTIMWSIQRTHAREAFCLHRKGRGTICPNFTIGLCPVGTRNYSTTDTHH
jgi:hypothetical protein